MAEKMDKVNKLLESHPDLYIKEREHGKYKVVCGLTSHEMPCTIEAVQTYVDGKKYKYERENKLTSDEKELCSLYLIEKRRDQLYCKLTKRYLNNKPHQIRQHLNGRRFKKAVENSKTHKSTNLTQENLNEHLEAAESEKETEIWIPSDSESESAEIDELGPEFEEKPSGCMEEDNSCSFDVLEVEEKNRENGDEKSTKKQGPKKKLKRSAKHLESKKKSKKKDKKLQRNDNETPKKKKKRT